MIYSLFLNALQEKPDAQALITSTGEHFSYAMMAHRVNQWALFLQKQGIGAGDRVAVLLDNEDHHPFIYLALNRLKAPYVPFDTDIPKGILRLDIETLGLKKFLIEASLVTDFVVPDALQISLSADTLEAISTAPALAAASDSYTPLPEKVEYIVSSSGSTGKKKWIPILGAGLAYWDRVIKKQFAENPFASFLATRSPAYDARIFEYLCSFSMLGSLRLLNRKERKDFPSIVKVVKDSAIECLILIASQLGSENSANLVPLLKKQGLKHLMVTGDACTPYLKSLCEQSGITLWNCYGPTEATFGLSILAVNGLKTQTIQAENLVPIAPPLEKELNAHLIEGQLCIESPYLTPGYLGEEGQDSAFRTVTDALGKTIRVFDTGDLFEEQEGFFFYRGRYRFDSHCKIDGVKVTASHIEHGLLHYNQISGDAPIQAVVVIKEHLGRAKPFAYIVETVAGTLNKNKLMAYLQDNLKKEEIPLLFKLEKLPRLSTSEKIDRQQLIARVDAPCESFLYQAEEKQEESPSDRASTRAAIKKIWQQLLKINNISEDAEFIFLGGNSLLALAMVKRINEVFHTDYSYTQLLGLTKITIQTVAESLFIKRPLSRDQALIQPLVEKGRKKKIFCLPALLGEGYFSYKHLADMMAEKFENWDIFGLTDPGTLDASFLPDSLEHAARRYIAAIRTIQPKGPYYLLGFSFGSTLAYAVARQLYKEGEMVKEIHLLDGLPPHLYQIVSQKAHLDLLYTLIGFIVTMLNNSYYGEHLNKITIKDGEIFSKQEQITKAFNHLEKKAINSASKNLLATARCHLGFMQTERLPKKKLPQWPTLYLTKKEQEFLQLIDKLPAVSKSSADYKTYFWGEYFCNLTRCGIELNVEHLEVLKSEPAQRNVPNSTANCYWVRAFDPIFNIKDDFYGPKSFYRLEKINNNEYQFSKFFLHEDLKYDVLDSLTILGFKPYVSSHKKIFPKYEQADQIYSAGCNVFVRCSADKIPILQKHYKDATEKPPRTTGLRLFDYKAEAKATSETRNLDLMVYKNNALLLTLSFAYHSMPRPLVDALSQQLQIEPFDFSMEGGNLLYVYSFKLRESNIFNVIKSVEDFLADFISVLAPYTSRAGDDRSMCTVHCST